MNFTQLTHLDGVTIYKYKKNICFIYNNFFLKCGDIVEVKANTSFPCDMLLLYCQSEDRTCHITTANLDGESNLKVTKTIIKKT